MNDTSEVKTEEEIIQGKIISLDSKRGFGFISAPSIKFTRIFFHWSALRGDTLHFTKLKRGMKVEFIARNVPDQVVEGIKVHKGWRAIKIKVIEDVRNMETPTA